MGIFSVWLAKRMSEIQRKKVNIMINIVALTGRLVADPELRHTQSGTAVCSFRLAVDRNFTDPAGQRPADFISITAWRGTAEFVCKYFEKGQMIAISGRIQTRNYEDKNGEKRAAVEVVAENVSFCGSKKASAYDQIPPNFYGDKNKVKMDKPEEPDWTQEAFDSDDDLPF